MKRKLFSLFLMLVMGVGSMWAESSVIATTKALVDAATVNTATAATGWVNTVENGGIYTFGSDTYIGAATNDAVTAAFAGEGYVTVAAWVYGQPSGCIFGFGEHSNGVKFHVNGQTMSMTTKGVSDFASQSGCKIYADQWNFIAYTIPGTGNTSATNSRFYYTTTDGSYNSKSVSNMAATSNNQCAIGSGNSNNARETFTGTMANLTIISSDALLNNSDIAALVGAAPLKANQAYLIKNVASNSYLSLSKTESGDGEVSLQTIGNCEAIYFETSSTGGAFKIKNAADPVKYLNANSWYAKPMESTETTWQIMQAADGVRLKASTGYLAPNNVNSIPVALWSDKGATDANGVYQLVEANLSYFETEFSNKIAECEAMIGTDPGCYREDDARKIITAAQTALKAEGRTIASLQSAYNTLTADISNLNIIQPEGGKTYQIVSALPGFKAQQGVEKAMYANGDNLSWATLDELNKAYYWTLVPAAEGYTMKNCSDATKLYPGVQGTTSSDYPMAADAVDVILTSLGSKQFTLKTTGSSNAMHCGGHSSGAGTASNIVAWDGTANTASAWYIREVEIPSTVQITYQIKDGENVIWSQEKTGKIGEAYPTPTWHNTFVTLSGVPEGNVTDEETVVLTANTTNMPVAMSATVESATYYALDVHGNEAKYPLYYNSEDDTNVQVEYTPYTSAEFYTDGAAKSQNYAWAFIGDAVRGFKVYNKAKDQYMVQANDKDEKVTFGNEGTLFQLYNTTSGLANSFAIKATDRSYYLNHRNSYVQGWTAADGGSSFRAYAINIADAKYSVTINEDKYSTLIVPFYAEIPEGMNVYTVESVTDGTINLTSVSGLIKPNTAYIIDGTPDTYNLSNTSKSNGAGTTNYTTGLLTGVLTDGGSTIPNGSYVLATRNSDQKQAFFQTNGTVTCPQYKCYLTVPAGVQAYFFANGVEEATGIENVLATSAQDGKYLENGQLVIVKNGVKYNAAGQIVK